MKRISIVTPTFNEQENIKRLVGTVKMMFRGLDYSYEHIIIDNDSRDRTQEILRHIAKEDKHVRVIINSRNFGQVRSPFYGLLQSSGDAVIALAADFQDPPELIPKFIKKWEEGFKIVVGVKNKSRENKLMFILRKIFYSFMKRISETEQIKNFSGFALYDKSIIKVLRELKDPYPYIRGIIPELGFEKAIVKYVQPSRQGGKSSNNLFSLYHVAMLGITSYSKVPLRMAVFISIVTSILSFLAGLFYLVYKLIYWESFTLGLAPLIIGLFFFSSVQLFFIGILGEYIGNIYTKVEKKPLVIEKERINFSK